MFTFCDALLHWLDVPAGKCMCVYTTNFATESCNGTEQNAAEINARAGIRHGQTEWPHWALCWQQGPTAAFARKSILDSVPTIGAIDNPHFEGNVALRRLQFCCDRFR